MRTFLSPERKTDDMVEDIDYAASQAHETYLWQHESKLCAAITRIRLITGERS